MLQTFRTNPATRPPLAAIPATMQTVAVFATVDGERVKVNFKRGADKYGWWQVSPVQNPREWYFCQRAEMTNLTRQVKLV